MAVIIDGSRTEKNLAAAYARESMSYNRYTYFARQATKHGFDQIGHLFLEAAENELEHARLFLNQLPSAGSPIPVKVVITSVRVNSTVENLTAAAASATQDADVVYARYAEIAAEEGFQAIAALFRRIAGIAIVHARRFKVLAQQVETESVFKRKHLVRWKCRRCGFVQEGMAAPAECPGCAGQQSFYEQTEMLE
jgi:rubrerythrin